jgi:predicted permease
MDAFAIIFPDFACIALGVVLRRFLLTEERFWVGVERLAISYSFPRCCFARWPTRPLHWATR